LAPVHQGHADGDEPEDVCHYRRSHPFLQETTNDQFFDEAQWESYRRLGQHVGHGVLPKELFDHLAMTASNEAGGSARE
jgi:hypothetical protein